MMSIIWAIIIIILIFAFGIVGVIVRLLKEIFMPGKSRQNPHQNRQTYSRTPYPASHKKIIDKNEGEYVEFEEIIPQD